VNDMTKKVSFGSLKNRQIGKLIEKRRFSSLVMLKSGKVKELRNRILTFYD